MSSHATSASAAYGLPEDLASYRLLTSDEAALVLCVPVATLRTWRSRRRGYGPRAVQVGGSVRYRLADLLAWIDDHTETPEDELSNGVEASQRGKASPAELPSLTRNYRPSSKAGGRQGSRFSSQTAR